MQKAFSLAAAVDGVALEIPLIITKIAIYTV